MEANPGPSGAATEPRTHLDDGAPPVVDPMDPGTFVRLAARTVDVGLGRDDPVTIISLSGRFDDDLVRTASRHLPDHDESLVIIDVTETTVANIHVEVPSSLLEARHGSIAFVCRRRTGRRILDMVLDHQAPVFATVEDALQALVMSGNGYGRGW